MYWEKIWQLRFFRAVSITIFYFMLFLGTAPAQEKEMSAETKVQSKKSLSSEYTWHYAAVSVTLVSALMSYNAAKSYNDLSAKNNTLARTTVSKIDKEQKYGKPHNEKNTMAKQLCNGKTIRKTMQ